jgi:hypothetical protein
MMHMLSKRLTAGHNHQWAQLPFPQKTMVAMLEITGCCSNRNALQHVLHEHVLDARPPLGSGRTSSNITLAISTSAA